MQKRHGQLKEHSIGRPRGAPQTVPMETAERRNVEFAVEGGVTRRRNAELLAVRWPESAADAERDVRGFGLKFYTEEGNWDLVGNNTSILFVWDPLKFPDFTHTQKRDPKTNMQTQSLTQVVILGGGFGGLSAAKELAGQDVGVTLIDKTNHHLFQPLLYQVATGGLSPADIAQPIRHILNGSLDPSQPDPIRNSVVAADAKEVDQQNS